MRRRGRGEGEGHPQADSALSMGPVVGLSLMAGTKTKSQTLDRLYHAGAPSHRSLHSSLAYNDYLKKVFSNMMSKIQLQQH